MTAPADRALLQRLAAGPVSGDALARESGLTRAAVWKRIEALREAGVAIDARAGRGYALAAPVELLDAAAIRAALPPAVAGQLADLDVAWSLDSTNSELLRRSSAGRGALALFAERQTGGRGRRGRSRRGQSAHAGIIRDPRPPFSRRRTTSGNHSSHDRHGLPQARCNHPPPAGIRGIVR